MQAQAECDAKEVLVNDVEELELLMSTGRVIRDRDIPIYAYARVLLADARRELDIGNTVYVYPALHLIAGICAGLRIISIDQARAFNKYRKWG